MKKCLTVIFLLTFSFFNAQKGKCEDFISVLNSGCRYLNEGKLELAQIKFAHALNIKSKDSKANFYMGKCLLMQRRFALALEFFEKAYDLGLKTNETILSLIYIYDCLGDTQNAKKFETIAKSIN